MAEGWMTTLEVGGVSYPANAANVLSKLPRKIECIYLDMDGVLCDFISDAMAVHGKKYTENDWPRGVWEVTKVLGLDEDAFWKKVENYGLHFWLNLLPYSWTADLLKIVSESGIEWKILTAPSRHPSSHTGKVMWLQKAFGEYFADYVFAPHTSKGCGKKDLAGPGRLLIDDSDLHCDEWEAKGGVAIRWPQPWGKSPLPGNRIEWFNQVFHEVLNPKPVVGLDQAIGQSFTVTGVFQGTAEGELAWPLSLVGLEQSVDWSTESPERPGWYWFAASGYSNFHVCNSNDIVPVKVELDSQGRLFVRCNETRNWFSIYVSDMVGSWKPIEDPGTPELLEIHQNRELADGVPSGR